MTMHANRLKISNLIKKPFFSIANDKTLNFSVRLAHSSNTLKHKTNVPNSVDTNEVKKFQNHSSRWWNGPEFAPLRSMNNLRVPFIRDSFNVNDLNGVRLLDIGCGGGILAESLARLGANVTAIDPVPESIQIAIEHAKSSGFDTNVPAPEYLCTTIESLAETHANHFDGVIASEVLEHVDDLELFLRSALQCLRSDGSGCLIVTTINQTPLAYATIIFAAEKMGLIPSNTHDYDRFVPPESLRLLLEQDFNCRVSKVHGMSYNPLTGQWSWTQSQAINYALLAIKN